MPTEILLAGCGLAALTLLATAAWTDLTRRRIANRIPVGLILLQSVCLAAGAGTATLAGATVAALAVFLPGYVLWSRGIIGGGDVKLLAALAFWSGTAHLFDFLMITALAGGALALAQLSLQRLPVPVWCYILLTEGGSADEGAATGPTLPYGIAIAGGGLWLLSQTVPFPALLSLVTPAAFS